MEPKISSDKTLPFREVANVWSRDSCWPVAATCASGHTTQRRSTRRCRALLPPSTHTGHCLASKCKHTCKWPTGWRQWGSSQSHVHISTHSDGSTQDLKNVPLLMQVTVVTVARHVDPRLQKVSIFSTKITAIHTFGHTLHIYCSIIIQTAMGACSAYTSTQRSSLRLAPRVSGNPPLTSFHLDAPS